MLAFLEDKAGVPLPPAVYTQVLVPGSAAQEVSSFSVIGKRMLDGIVDDPQDDWVIVHEMAHQWWGNLVTCASWSEFWLNEGITVFMTAAWNQHRWGEAGYRREIDGARERWQRAQGRRLRQAAELARRLPEPAHAARHPVRQGRGLHGRAARRDRRARLLGRPAPLHARQCRPRRSVGGSASRDGAQRRAARCRRCSTAGSTETLSPR